MLRTFRFLTIVVVGASIALAQSTTTETVTADLQSPSHVRFTPRGNLVVAENGAAANAGRISIVTTAGARRSVIEGLPAGPSPEGGISGPTDVAWSGQTLYVLIGVGDVEGAGPTPGTTVPNPKGISSVLLSSLLKFTFATDLDSVQGPFQLTAAQHQQLWDGETLTLRSPQGEEAQAQLVVDFRDTVPDPRTIYRGSNPYAIALTSENTAWVADASLDAVYRVDLVTGRARLMRRFGSIANPTQIGPPNVDSVPNGIVPYGSGFLIVQLSGFPFAAGNGRIQYYDPQTGEVMPFINGLTMPIDVAFTNRDNQRPRFFVLEFSGNFLATPPGPGRLILYDTPEGRAVKSDLVTPTSMAVDASGDVYITELATGRLLRVRVTQ